MFPRHPQVREAEGRFDHEKATVAHLLRQVYKLQFDLDQALKVAAEGRR